MSTTNYDHLSREDLISRLKFLESKVELNAAASSKSNSTSKKSKVAKPFSFTSYPKRKIALKFSYAGWEYNGLAFQMDRTALPTVEGVLFDALAAVKLVDPDAGPKGCGWERCGRTDKGVSSAGQVVSLWVRSNVAQGDEVGGEEVVESSEVPIADPSRETLVEDAIDDDFPFGDMDIPASNLPSSSSPQSTSNSTSNPKSEIRYISLLNQALPPTIRILAWSPVSPSFSARFACTSRHYKYFFLSHNLDLAKMRLAALYLVGEHDFRNLCKVDASKQITNFRRRVVRAEISAVENSEGEGEMGLNLNGVGASASGGARLYTFDLVGNAFLYHQVRHIMAVLFLVGSGLEDPEIVPALLNANEEFPERLPTQEGGFNLLDVVDCKPEYRMADGLPLMLWECGYNEGDVKWRTDDDDFEGPGDHDEGTSNLNAETGSRNVYHDSYALYSRSLIHTALDQHFLKAASAYHRPPPSLLPLSSPNVLRSPTSSGSNMLNIPIGGGVTSRMVARSYVPLLLRKRGQPVEVINARWLKRKGAVKAVVNDGDDGDE